MVRSKSNVDESLLFIATLTNYHKFSFQKNTNVLYYDYGGQKYEMG